MSIATLTIAGNVGAEPNAREVQTKDGPRTVLSFRVATESGWGESKATTWWTVSIFCRSDRARDYFQHAIYKGAFVVATGTASTRTYDGRDGNTHFVAQLDADDVTVQNPPTLESLAMELGTTKGDLVKRIRATFGNQAPQAPAGEFYDEDCPF